MNKIILLPYVPVIHRGYIELLTRHQDAKMLYVLDRELAMELDPHLRKDVRALDSRHAKLLLGYAVKHTGMGFGVAGELTLTKSPNFSQTLVVMPDEGMSHELAKRFLFRCETTFEPIFLRWERSSSLTEQEVRYDRKIPYEGLARRLMGLALAESRKASNWWRQVGAVIARRGKVLLAAHNQHVPSPHMPYIEGDPRMYFSRGVHIELTTDHHAEARLISEAARKGIALEGTELYVTTFPCPPCGKLVAYSGIRRLYFAEGYSLLDSERILRDQRIEIIQVEMKGPES